MTTITRAGHSCIAAAFRPGNVQASDLAATVPDDVRYDTLVGAGMSGALAVPLIAQVLGKDYAIVRKQGDAHHHDEDIRAEGNIGESWIFVDDGIRRGGTLRNAQEVIADLAPHATFAGLYLYGDGDGGMFPPLFYRPGEVDELITRAAEQADQRDAFLADPFIALMRELVTGADRTYV